MDLNLARWVMIAETIRSVAGAAYLAGGCLRDLDNNRPAKDVDIFVPEGSDIEAVMDALRRDFDSVELEGEVDFSSCEGMKDVLGSFLMHVGAERTQVNVIVLEGAPTMAFVLDRMDFGLCQIGHDGGSLVRTEAYCKDALDGTLTLTRKDSEESYQRSLKRYERLSQKYAGWTLVDRFA